MPRKPDSGERLFCIIRDTIREETASPTMLGIALMGALDDGKWQKAPPAVQNFLANVEKQLGTE
jgi:hypothetical protein